MSKDELWLWFVLYCGLFFKKKPRTRRPNGSGTITTHGYLMHSTGTGIAERRVFEHTRVAEKALGKALPPKAAVHHVDGNPLNNEPTNLVICPDHAYHKLLHQRTRALAACGNPEWRKCTYCKSYDAPENMNAKKHRNALQFNHRACRNKYRRALWARQSL